MSGRERTRLGRRTLGHHVEMVLSGRKRRHNGSSVAVLGFGPFCGIHYNPAEWLVRSVARRSSTGEHFSVVPVSTVDVDAAIRSNRGCRIIIWVGLDASAKHAWLELGAQNLMDFVCADERGFQPRGEPIDPRFPVTHMRWSMLPVLAINRRLRACGYRIGVRLSGGTFVSNYAYYRSLVKMRGHALYLHVPTFSTAKAPSFYCLCRDMLRIVRTLTKSRY
jgi:pyrrolidone-carboxylate peptidase